jgi:hypothetical protein
MNEQIEKLISESIKAIPDHVDFDLPKEFTEKFAELIVRECAKTAEQHIDERCYRDYGVGVRLKKHFGVEE